LAGTAGGRGRTKEGEGEDGRRGHRSIAEATLSRRPKLTKGSRKTLVTEELKHLRLIKRQSIRFIKDDTLKFKNWISRDSFQVLFENVM
jgi:hypothetical protein